MLTDHDKISLITSIYQSGSNVSQFLQDLKLLSEVLDGPKKSTKPDLPQDNESSTCQSGFDAKTQTIVNSWKTVLATSDPESPNPNLLKFQEQFLYDNEYVPGGKTNHKFYLTARSVGITTAFAIHAARSLIQQPNLKILYIAESNDAIESFQNGVFALLPKDLIDSKDSKSLRLSNGSLISFISQPSLHNGLKETTGTIQQRAAQYLDRWGTPNILFIDDAESISFSIVTPLVGLIKLCPNVIIAGGVSDSQGLPYCVMTGANNLWIEKKIIPWYEGTVSDQDFIKSCLTEEQYLESQLCQFPRKPKEIIVESKLSNAYNELVNIIFKPTLSDGQPDMAINSTIASGSDISHRLEHFKNKYLTPWMHKIGEIGDKSEVEIVEEIDKNTGKRVFKISVGDIPPERVAEILEKAKSEIDSKTL